MFPPPQRLGYTMSIANLKSAKYLAESVAAEQQPKSRNPTKYVGLLSLLLIVGGAGFAAWNCYQQNDLVAATAVVLVTLGALNGFRRGLLGMVISLIAFGVAYHFAPQFGLAHEATFSEHFGTTGVLNRGLSIAAAGIFTFAAFNLFSSLVLRFLLGKPNNKLSANHVLGFVAGAAQAGAAILLFLGGFVILQPTLPQETAPPAMLRFTEQVQSTQLRPWVDQYNPFVHVPQLNQFQQVKQTVAALSDPAQVKRILTHPSVKELREDPATEAAMLGLMRDPEMSKLLKSNQRFDDRALQKVLQNEAVMKLLDQPQFLERAQQVLSESL